MFILDTNVISELRRANTDRADANVVEWARSTPAPLLHVSVISLHELEVGVLQRERSDPHQGAVLRRWLETQVGPTFGGRELAVTADVARRAATFHVPDPAPIRDALIAATARVHGMTVVTRNRRDFDRFDGVAVFDPWR